MSDNPRIGDLRRRVQKDPASIAFAQLAEEYRRAGQYAEAVEVCRAGLTIHPGYLSARVTLGRALLELGELDPASQELQTVLAGAPENLSAIRGLAEIHQRRGNLAAALVQYQTALSLAANDPDLERTVSGLVRQVQSDADSVSPGLPDPERDQAVQTVAALEGFLAAIHAAGANRRA
jgi:tetratricopeptide (TPR) repeat protein